MPAFQPRQTVVVFQTNARPVRWPTARLVRASLGIASLSLTTLASAADPVAELKSFTEFRSLNLPRMLAGDIMGERGSLMEFPQGIVAQTCFVVPLAADEAAQRLQVWNPSSREEAPRVLAFNSVGHPCRAADFENLRLRPNQKSERWLLDKSRATTATKSELSLTRDEARHLAECARGNPDSQAVSACWAKLLLQRATAFQRQGFDGVSPYEVNGDPVFPAQQVRTMLTENPAVAREFAPLLERSGVLGNKPVAAAQLVPFHYWGLCEANRQGTRPSARSTCFPKTITTSCWTFSIT